MKRTIFAEGKQSISNDFRFSFGAAYNLMIRLCAPTEINNTWKIEFYIQSVADPSLIFSLEKVLKRADVPPETVAVALQKIAVSAKLSRFSNNQHLTNDEALEFITADAFRLQSANIIVHVPHLPPKSALSIVIRPNVSKFMVGKIMHSGLLDFNYEVTIGDQQISPSEFQKLVENKSQLVCVNEKWTIINKETAAKVAKLIKDESSRSISSVVAMTRQAAEQGIETSVVSEGRTFDSVLQAISDREPAVAIPHFKGELRSYQERGVSWINFCHQMNFGTLLADDMGLGKTIQVIAYTLHYLNRYSSPILIICPTSVIENWRSEFARFAPNIRVTAHHGINRTSGTQFKHSIGDVLITSYGISRRDKCEFSSISWGIVVVDEAQNIKNPLAQQSAAIKKINSMFRIALTGTPIENRLSDLWSLMEFLNPGYLHSWEQFKKTFVQPIELGDDEKKRALRSLLSPFILRRLKTDKTIITDLPEKTVKTEWCALTLEQASLYKATADAALKNIGDDVNGKKIAILAALTKLKQICNHPSNFLKDSRALGVRSGKVERLRELLSFIISNNESCLVFSQYREMCEMLHENLKKEFNVPFLLFHGGMSMKQRKQVIEDFQQEGAKIMIISLKAGGTGLNLTQASRVIHFDRWWNPAVESQATDRIHRIGQKKNVFVHTLVTKGTIEEHIEEIIEKKRTLSDSILVHGEDLLKDLDAKKLKQIFSLRDER
ncbi:MAG TPA: DEAD/DEAH box helicase [Candidatus Nanoarchaeia archaeon]|nr:DEAD/DEAH box helicase [Candidatus Nanoarchaeia archaeon]